MRLTCPNCSAKYEVDESMIPAVGRDVQCSNCATTWFQPGVRPADPEPAPAEPAAEDAAPEMEGSDPVDDTPEPEQDPAPAPTPQPDPEPQLEEIDIRGSSGAMGTDAGDDALDRPARRQIEAGVADILRQEAEREARLRRGNAEPAAVQTQSEMSLSGNEDRNRARRLVGLEEAEDAFEVEDLAATAAAAAAAPTPTPSRSDLLPDIEEINSTLRATGDRSEDEDDASDVDTIVESARRRGRGRFGFFLALVLVALAVVLYLYAEQITEAAPQAGPALERYVELVNAGRFWLDGFARSLAGGAAGPSE
ncbi:zinc-ribbon domain-containing protein [Gymnodinialimonas ulvae]|uniref:zinc-ribbon domain-containing protein n=1 Tax=Gymnodinialimonas ulvae TaxID=3126504 RepID=UPI0030AA9CB5